MASIYDELGGRDSMRTAVSVLYRRIIDDEALRPWFEDIDVDRLTAHQRSFLAAAFGGPQTFSGRDLAAAHAGMEITDEAFDHVVSMLVSVLDDLGAAPQVLTKVAERLDSLRGEVVGL